MPKKNRPKWTKWVVTIRLDSQAEALEFADHVRRTGEVYMPQSSEWQKLNAEVASQPQLDPRGGQLAQHQHYLDGERPK